MNPKKWPSGRGEQGARTCLVYVEIGPTNEQRDHVSNLLLKQAKEVLKDALVTRAERLGGKLDSWKDHSGTFLFLADGPDGYDNSCKAAIEMLDELPSVKEVVRLSGELGGLIAIRLVCDTGPIIHDPDGHNLTSEFAGVFKKHASSASLGNKVTITERVYRQLHEPLKSRFQRLNRSSEFGVDFYSLTDHPLRVGPALAQIPEETEPTVPGSSTPAPVAPTQDVPAALGSKRGLGSLGPWAGWGVAGVTILGFGILAQVHFSRTPPQPAGTSAGTPQYPELVQSEGWRAWRQQIHEKLSGGKVTENVLADALKAGLPARPEHAAAALRRDQAIGEVLMSYPPVKDLLWDRFGIDEHNFLGTGLSKPSSALTNYGAASVHEYLIKNNYSDSRGIWLLTFDPVNNPDKMHMKVSQLFGDDPKAEPKKNERAAEIVRRVEKKDPTMPGVIRFARFNAARYSRKLGPEKRRYVFASDLAEVWNLTVWDAAKLSGYISDDGDTVYIWVFLPGHASDVVPATWDQVLQHLPTWLTESDKN